MLSMDNISKEIRANILNISHHSGHGHIPTCFSVVEMLRAVYETMQHDPKQPDWDERDIFILSKGHAALGLYCTDRFKVPGVELSSGSLGHGIGVAVGMALGLKLSGSARNVFVLIGDGESNEGTVWEAVMVAANLGLDNLTVLFDNNCSQSRCLPISRPEEKFDSFGFTVLAVDGHDLPAIKNAIQHHPAKGASRVIVAHTTKGKGCPSVTSDVFAWHRRSPNKDELKTMLGELNETSI